MSDADFHYPPVDERNLKLALRIYESNPGYLDDPECPYSQDLKDLFRGTAKVHDFTSHGPAEIPDGDRLNWMINELQRQLSAYSDFIDNNEEATASDRNTYFRISTMLLEKSIEQREKVMNIKQYEVFQTFLLDFMDKEMNVDQRSLFMEKIKMLGVGLTTSTSSVTSELNKNKTEGANALSNPVPTL